MKLLYAALFAAIPLTAALAKRDDPQRAPAFQQLVTCRTISEPAARLACYDKEVAAVDAAEQAQEIIIVDKTQVRQTRRSLFGLSLPNLKLFGDKDDTDPVTEITSTIRSVRQGIDGYTVVLADGTIWTQIDTRSFPRSPKPGLEVIVKRAALGSFIMRIQGSPGIKVRRVI